MHYRTYITESILLTLPTRYRYSSLLNDRQCENCVILIGTVPPTYRIYFLFEDGKVGTVQYAPVGAYPFSLIRVSLQDDVRIFVPQDNILWTVFPEVEHSSMSPTSISC